MTAGVSKEEEMVEAIELSNREPHSDWQPPELAHTSRVFVWPPRPFGLVKWLLGYPGYILPWNLVYAAIAVLTWELLTPDPSRMKSLSVEWISIIFCTNLALLVAVVSAWHVRLYVQRAQGMRYKYKGRWLATNNRTFLFSDQLRDNVFWNLVSAVPIWTAYEVLTLWLQANGSIPSISWRTHPVYCTALMFVIPLFEDVHFYAVHRLLHWRPLYRAVHSLHHKNVNPGPWSGLAMHPVEHILFFSSVLLYWIVPSHPLHVIFSLQLLALTPSQGHSGFHRVVLGSRVTLPNDNYIHYLHHKYFVVNFASEYIPLDKWFGTFHDGSREAQETMISRGR
jgi:sterol desaturase/sphingolipid hydroxylase (fatty acid hydroxylase superfamily)